MVKPSSSLLICCLLWTITMSIMIVHGQYPGYNGPSPYHPRAPMAFSPYHPARINHETLPISQAEFAQLVAESMATSRGPHHHHPPNTDADYEGPDHWNKESASSAPVPKSMHPNHVHPANRPAYPTQDPRQPDQSAAAAAMYHQQQRSQAQSSMSMAHPHHMRQYSPYSSMRPQPTSASAPSPYNNQYHPSDVESSHDDDYRREPASAHHPSQSMQYQPEESRFANSDDDNDDQYMRAPVYDQTPYGPQQETSEDEPEPHTYGGRPSSGQEYSNSAQANYHAINQRHPGQLENSQQMPQSMHDYQNERVHPMTAAMLHQHQTSQSVPEPMSGPSPIGPQQMYRPNDPSSLAYHQDFSKQMNRANYHPSASSAVSSPVHPFSSHGYPAGYGHSRPIHPSAAHLQRMQMYGDGSNHQANYYNAHHASYARHHQHPHAYPRRPEDMYMAASSETDSLVAVPGTTDSTSTDDAIKPTKTPVTTDKTE